MTIQQARVAPDSLSAQSVLHLQRTIGNQAVSAMLGRTIQRDWEIVDQVKQEQSITIKSFQELTDFLGKWTLVKNYPRYSEERNKRVQTLKLEIGLKHFDEKNQKYTSFSVKGGNLGFDDNIDASQLGSYLQTIFSPEFDPEYSYHVTDEANFASVFAYGLMPREKIVKILKQDVGLDAKRGDKISTEAMLERAQRNSAHVYAVSDTGSIADYAGYYRDEKTGQKPVLIVRFKAEAVAKYIEGWKRDHQGKNGDKRTLTDDAIPSEVMEYTVLEPKHASELAYETDDAYKFLHKLKWVTFQEYEEELDRELGELTEEFYSQFFKK